MKKHSNLKKAFLACNYKVKEKSAHEIRCENIIKEELEREISSKFKKDTKTHRNLRNWYVNRQYQTELKELKNTEKIENSES